MIRFVHVGRDIFRNNDPSDKCRRTFSFYDTSSDKFIELEGAQTWITWQDFIQDLEGTVYESQLFRFERLTPSWAKDHSLPMPSLEEQYDEV